MPSARRTSQAATAAAASSIGDTAKFKTTTTTTTSTSSEAGPSSNPTTNPTTSSTPSAPAQNQKEEPSTDLHLELLTEHFGYNPKSFIDALVYLSNEHLYNIATEFENVVLSLLADTEGGELEAEQGLHAILTLMENALDHTLDTFELYCFRSVFGIRGRQARFMTLDHHRGLDLRNVAPKTGAEEGKKHPKGGRKSAITPSTAALSAKERSYQLGETEDSLKRQIAAARATQHKLLLAQTATESNLNRMLEVAERFSSILYPTSSTSTSSDTSSAGGQAGVLVLSETLGQHARKLKADTIPLLKALKELRSTDPLGEPLYSGASAKKETVESGDGEDEGEQGTDVRAWERGREGYLNWEADRIIAKSKRGATSASGAGSGATTAAGGEEGEEAEGDDATPTQATTTGEDDSKTPKRKRTAAAPNSSKRRTPGTATRPRS